MKHLVLPFCFVMVNAFAQPSNEFPIFDGRHWGVVVDHPDISKVTMKPDVPFLEDSQGILKLDVYTPPGLSSTEKRPAIIFLNAIGDQPGQPKVKSWGIYTSWPRLAAANGFVGISMECDGSRVQETLAGLFSFLDRKGDHYNINRNQLGVYAASANVTQASIYLMGEKVYPGIKAAALYYGRTPEGPFRKDLPVLFVVAEGDVRGSGYATLWAEVLKNKAPWTIVMGSGLIHAFDAFSDTDDARRTINATLSFWKNNLETIPGHKSADNIGREVLAAEYGGNPQRAATLLKEWLETHPENESGLMHYGEALKDLKDYVGAEEVFRKVLKRNPENASAAAALIEVLYAQDKFAEAQKVEAMAAKFLTAQHYSDIGISLYIMNRHNEGVKYFEKVMTIKPRAWDYYNLACGYARLNQPDKAFPPLEKSIELGYATKTQIEEDNDFDLVRSDKRYAEIIAKAN